MTKYSRHTQQYRSPWLVLLLGVVTFGLYAYIWVSQRYAESVEDNKWRNHWSVATCIFLLGILCGMGLAIISPIVISDAAIAAAVTVYGGYGLFVLAQLFASWWLVYHVKLLNNAWQVPVKLPSTIIMALLFSPFLIWCEQRRLNDDDSESLWFIRFGATTASAVVGLSLTGLVYANYPINEEIQSLRLEYQTLQEYAACHQDLEARYKDKEVDDAQYQTYLTEYADCESITEDW